MHKEQWDSLITLFGVHHQLKQEGFSLKSKYKKGETGEMSINDFALKIKSICKSLYSININLDVDVDVDVHVSGLGP